MSNMHPHDFHQLVRTWLLAEDPYGVNNRIEPTFGNAAAPAPAAPAAPPPDTRGQTAGPQAVERELRPSRSSESGRNAMIPDRASSQGETAVQRALAPSPTAEVDRTRAQAWGEDAIDREFNPPAGSGAGFWAPGEAADTASAVGEQAVGGALAKKARGKIARGRLKDPRSEDDAPSE